MKSISADTSVDLTTLVEELDIKQSQIVQIVWTNNHFTLFYYV